LIWVNATVGRSIILASFPTERPMPKSEFYYLILVCLSFSGFGIALAASCLQYRRWLTRQVPVKSRR
jgi:hypothetical protein